MGACKMNLLTPIDCFFQKQFAELGDYALFIRAFWQRMSRVAEVWHLVVEQTWLITIRTLLTVIFSGVFVGAIVLLQFHLMLKEYDALAILGGLNTSALVREVAPLIISFLIAGKIGAYTAAELGTMRVTEQIDAIECLGTDSMHYIILPRIIGIQLAGCLLLMVGLLTSVLGSCAIAMVISNVNPLQFVSTIPRFVGPYTVVSGFIKAILYCSIVAGVSCFKGYRATGGAKGVGQAVTEASIYTNFYIVLTNYISSGFLNTFQSVYESIFERFAR